MGGEWGGVGSVWRAGGGGASGADRRERMRGESGSRASPPPLAPDASRRPPFSGGTPGARARHAPAKAWHGAWPPAPACGWPVSGRQWTGEETAAPPPPRLPISRRAPRLVSFLFCFCRSQFPAPRATPRRPHLVPHVVQAGGHWAPEPTRRVFVPVCRVAVAPLTAAGGRRRGGKKKVWSGRPAAAAGEEPRASELTPHACFIFALGPRAGPRQTTPTRTRHSAHAPPASAWSGPPLPVHPPGLDARENTPTRAHTPAGAD